MSIGSIHTVSVMVELETIDRGRSINTNNTYRSCGFVDVDLLFISGSSFFC